MKTLLQMVSFVSNIGDISRGDATKHKSLFYDGCNKKGRVFDGFNVASSRRRDVA
jgi:hypothetical protein